MITVRPRYRSPSQNTYFCQIVFNDGLIGRRSQKATTLISLIQTVGTGWALNAALKNEASISVFMIGSMLWSNDCWYKFNIMVEDKIQSAQGPMPMTKTTASAYNHRQDTLFSKHTIINISSMY